MTATQCERLLEYLKEHGSITQAEAMTELGIYRLGARIWDLKNRHGIPIRRTMVKVKNRFNETCSVASYSVAE